MPILRIRDKNGEFVHIPAIKGDDGKSAYEQAVEGGFQGTEEEFVQLLASLSTSMQLQLLELDEDQTYLEAHISNKNNPHGVTAQQVGSLKIYYSFAALNKELGTAFDVTTPIETIIQAMPDNTGLIGDVNSYDKEVQIYPVVYGTLYIYKIRANRVIVEYVSNISEGIKGYNKRWVGQYNAGVFGGFKEVFTEAHPPTAEQVGAIPELVGNSVNFKMNFLLGDHNKMHSIDTNVPVLPVVSNYIHMYTMADGLVKTCLSVPYDYTQNAYYYTAYDKVWRKFADASGGVFSGNIEIFADKSKSPAISVGQDNENRARFLYTSNGNVDMQNISEGKANTFSLAHENSVPLMHLLSSWTSDGKCYYTFGEHNKPVGSYIGDGSTERHITTGGIGNVLAVWSSDVLDFGALIMPSGAIFFRGGTLQTASKPVCYFENGGLHIYGNYITLNEANKTYKYQVL